MGQSIVEIRTFGEALRNTGYKSIDSAIAEIVDNSIEAEAEDIFIIFSEDVNPEAKRKVKKITEIAFLDNGIGMNVEVLGKCLGYGIGTRYERKGMGRFGVGLPQASMYACTRVEVFSWQNGIENCKKVYLDINEVTEGIQTEIEEPVVAEIPEKYKKFIHYQVDDKQYDFCRQGTLVVWEKCDRVVPKTFTSLKKLLKFSLGQKFRYFLTEGKQKIRIVNYNNQSDAFDIKPNDPMLLMENNMILGNVADPGSTLQEGELEPLFELYGEQDFPVEYWDKKTEEKKESTVKIRFSKIKSKFYDKNAFPKGNPGNSEMGKYVQKLQGISIIRAKREIDFGKFDYYSSENKPTHRWWGCEVIFTPELDEAFGVANNKQHVELKEVEATDYDEEEVKPMWLQLESIISNTIKNMVAANAKMQKNTRTKENKDTPAEIIVKEVERGSEDADIGITADIKKNVRTEDINDEIIDTMKRMGYENLTEEDIAGFRDSSVKIIYEHRGRGPFLDFDFDLGVARIYINVVHDFYKLFLSKMIEDNDSKTTFELYIAALVKAVDRAGHSYKTAYDQLMTDWEIKLKKYIDEQLHPRSDV